MRTEQLENGSPYYLGAMHSGTHIAHPDGTVDRRGTGLGWRQEAWLKFLVELTVTHARVLGAAALESAAAAVVSMRASTRKSAGAGTCGGGERWRAKLAAAGGADKPSAAPTANRRRGRRRRR
jgi:hypothetical protein